MNAPLSRRLFAEFLGSAFLAATVIGSGIAARDALARRCWPAAVRERCGDGRGPVHDHPHVRAGFRRALQSGRLARRRGFGGLRWRDALAYIPAQVLGCFAGAVTANGMFALAAISISTHHRASPAHLFAEVIATLGLLLVIFSLARSRRGAIAPAAVGAYIGAAYFFTSSTSFANPAITVGRMFSDTFAGIAPASVPGFVVAQLVGGALAIGVLRRCTRTSRPTRRRRSCCLTRSQPKLATGRPAGAPRAPEAVDRRSRAGGGRRDHDGLRRRLPVYPGKRSDVTYIHTHAGSAAD